MESLSQARYAQKIENDIVLHVRKVKNDFLFPPREGCVACGMGKKIYVYGGVIQSDREEPQESNDLLLFDIEKETWSQVPGKGLVPSARAAASLVAVGTKLYLFGGLSHMSGWFDDVFVFDTKTETWSLVETEGIKPRPRDKLQGVALGSRIYYFGGFGPKTDDGFGDMDEEEEDEPEAIPQAQDQEAAEAIPQAQDQNAAEFGWFNDLYFLDTNTHKWSQPIHMNMGVPTPRAAHGMCSVGNSIFIFGGRDIKDRQNDLHCYDAVTRKWDLDLNPAGVFPQPRSFHTTTAVSGRVVVIGGRGRDNNHFADIHIYDPATRQWLQPQVKGDTFSARGQHIAVETGGYLVVFGGTGKFSQETMQCQEFYADTFLISAGDVAKGGPKSSSNGH